MSDADNSPVMADVSAPPIVAEPERLAEPVDALQAPRLAFPVVGIGASAGGLQAFMEFFTSMPPASGMAFVLIQHLPPDRESMISEILSKRTKIPVHEVTDGVAVEPDHVYVIRPGHTLTLKDGALHLGESLNRPRHGRPVDDFFKSLAEEQQERAICIVMSGMGSNGAAGAQAIKAVGGLCIAQDPESAEFPSMPRSLIDAGYADYILRPKDMPDVILSYARHPYANQPHDGSNVAQVEQQPLREILAVLRTRTRHDFGGYKKPTVLRRIQRRMGLNRLTAMPEYAKLLRLSPTEVTALSDDLLIHVTGFFRDADAWEALRQRVIVPLVESREREMPIRCWVAACSSGEEAYTLAMLLVEETERVGKPLDIKIFATDTAERTLTNARGGVYPGGIEAEISAPRLERFFQKQDAVYRVRQELREKVVFAPQNLLRDPPFSRLDLVTCRNLFIYLEADLQKRVLSLIHFGLREGGALFLGNSEAISGAEELFEPIDKKARIFKRVGHTRHGMVDFPLPRLLSSERAKLDFGAAPRPSLAQMTQRALLEHHVPAAVTVDRENRIVYFHGDLEPYLAHPRGEAVRDILTMARENVRGAVRAALAKASSENQSSSISDGWIHTEQGTHRVVVTASPLDLKSAPDFFVVSFERRFDPAPAAAAGADDGNGHQNLPEELRRVREELQSTIEELQTSNEEHKASGEEVMSMNEELQSTNEELETSKEEMQSLNEELATVNAQLQSKMEELQSTTGDLTSLLSSTDIAVLFLDTDFRIRRFTTPVKDLLELISSDVGRPLSDLAMKFTDPELMDDARTVLSRLVPIEREVRSNEGRSYLRRVTPYRTIDNRIDGVVITFVEITGRIKVEQSLRHSEMRLAQELQSMNGLQELTAKLLAAADLQTALDELLTATMGLHGADLGSIQLLDHESQSLKIVAQRGFDAEFLADADDVGYEDESPPARTVRSAKRLVIEDVELDPASKPYRNAAYSAHFRALQLTPLTTHKGEVLGVLSTYFRKPHCPDERELRVTDLYARQAGDLIERIGAEEKLIRLLQNEQAARAVIDEAARVKDEFLATLSHELRTPLAAVLLWAKMLKKNPTDPTALTEGLRAIEISAESQARLIEDLLDTSRIAAGKIRLELAETDLAAVVAAAVDVIEPTAAAKGITLETDLGKQPSIVMADAERLQQVIWNLLINAVKFTPAEGKVVVKLTPSEGAIEVSISDNGDGIHADFLPHVFDRFRQAESPINRVHGGLGLGLAISKQLVEMHGGTITAASDGLRRGATFTVHLPLPRQRARKRNAQAAGANANSGPSLKGTHILFVEDDSPTRLAVTRVLTEAGAAVVAVDTSEAALAAFRESRPDLLLSDIALPDMDGYTLLRRIRSLEAEQKAVPMPAVALTAYASAADRQKAFDAGFGKHVGKPVDPDKLVAALRSLLPAK